MGTISVKMALILPVQFSHQEILKNLNFEQLSHPLCENGWQYYVSPYIRHHGDPTGVVEKMLFPLLESLSKTAEFQIMVTGSGGRSLSETGHCTYVNEFQAMATCIAQLYPDTHTIFEMGGETSKYIRFERDDSGIRLTDYETNGECAAGTGSFFDQQAERLKFSIEETGQLVMQTERAANIAGRCSVFAKSDMIHAQQRGYSPAEILKGLCHAVVRNFKGSIAKGKEIHPRVALIGGVAANQGIVQAFHHFFNLNETELFVPDCYAWAGALGAAMMAQKTGIEAKPYQTGISLRSQSKHPVTRPLSLEKVVNLRDRAMAFEWPEEGRLRAWLGIDIGSVSTNVVVLDDTGQVIDSLYCMTDGRPIEVVQKALNEMAGKLQHRVDIAGVGTTGSGRELIGMLVGADSIKDEITAHKTGALHISRNMLDEAVDTIFEIGGQDAKFIAMDQEIVVDFALNDACAAGTGSFLEEQANQLGIQIKGEFADMALRSGAPLKLGERCTVFMEKEMVPYLQKGVDKKDIVAGLAISVVQNYLNRVVKKRPIGDVIFFQGGTAYNDAVAAAFSTVLGKRIIVPPYNGVMGAVGAALLAKQSMTQRSSSTTFRGWQLDQIQWTLKEFTCQGCSNECQIQAFEIEGEKAYWGDKCSDKYRKRTLSSRKPSIPDLMRFRNDLLHPFFKSRLADQCKSRGEIGMPLALSFHDRLPFWKTYFETLGFDVLLSPETNQKLVNRGIEAAVSEPCFPVQAAHGHFAALADRNPDYLFMPVVVNEEDPMDSPASFICPWAQTFVLMAEHSPAFHLVKDKILSPAVYFRESQDYVARQLAGELDVLKLSSSQNRKAVHRAFQTQIAFKDRLIEAGREALEMLETSGEPAIVLVGRPYNLYDQGLNLNIAAKLRDLYGMNVIPMDFLPSGRVDIRDIHDHMYWNYGRRIIQTSRFLKKHEHIQMIYISNFKCGPDSYIRHFIDEALGRPFLFLQFDSHSNDAGVMTRVEAFLESKGLMS